MQEVKQPNKKPFIFYYLIALVAIMLINSLLVPQIVQRAVKEVDYNTFMQMTYDKQIDEVQVQDNQIVFTAKDDKTIYKTGLMDDPDRTQRLYDSGAKEVHIRPACPPLVYGCKFLNFSRSSSEMDLITRRVIARLEGTEDVSEEVLEQYTDPESEKYDQMVEEIRKELKFTSLRFNRLDDMLEAVGIPKEKLCTYCWNGKD